VRVLAALEALHELTEGSVVVQPDLIQLTGVTGNAEASDVVSRILSSRLGEDLRLELDLRYDRRLDPVLGLPTGPECVASLNAVLEHAKIAFEPGSSVIDAAAGDTLDQLAALMKNCADFRMEVEGHTDSQGRDEFNQELSQDRAKAVVDALMQRRVLIGNLQARGYGETQPIADNETEEGREANRRIAFVLLDATPMELAPAVQEAAPGSEAGSGAAGGEAGPGAAGEGQDEAGQDGSGQPEAALDGSIVIEAQPADDDTLRPSPRPTTPAQEN